MIFSRMLDDLDAIISLAWVHLPYSAVWLTNHASSSAHIAPKSAPWKYPFTMTLRNCNCRVQTGMYEIEIFWHSEHLKCTVKSNQKIMHFYIANWLWKLSRTSRCGYQWYFCDQVKMITALPPLLIRPLISTWLHFEQLFSCEDYMKTVNYATECMDTLERWYTYNLTDKPSNILHSVQFT